MDEVSPGHRKIIEFHQSVLELNGGTMFYCEPHITALYRAVLNAGSVAVDGGANVGLHTIQMAQSVVPDGLVLAIEPVPQSRERLEMHRREHSVPESLVRILPYALSSEPGQAEFYQVLDPIQHELSGLRQRDILNAHEVKKIVVEVTTLDAVCLDLERLDFLKLDLEGAELNALRGGRATVQKFRPVITIEQSQDSLRYFDYTWHDLTGYFTSLNYELYDLFGLHYTEPEMFEECAVWDFVGLPAEHPDKTALFEAVQRSMQGRGVILPGMEAQAANRNVMVCVLDRIGPVNHVMEQESVCVPWDTSIEFSGWAVDRDAKGLAGSVEIAIEDKVYEAAYGQDRGDIAAYFHNGRLLRSGFAVTLPAGELARGAHEALLRVRSREGTVEYEGPRVGFTVE